MAGFRALAQQVRDPGRAPSQRRRALRKCLERFAPYGHRATWRHLCARAGLHPDDRDPDPALLLAALEELEEARAVWLAYEAEVAARRRQEKRAGVRQPTALDEWHRLTWGGRSLLRCDPTAPPTPRLADVLRRMIAAVNYGADHGGSRSDGHLGVDLRHSKRDRLSKPEKQDKRDAVGGSRSRSRSRSNSVRAGHDSSRDDALGHESRAGSREDSDRAKDAFRALRAGQGTVVTSYS